MRLALITTAPSSHSGIGDYTRHLLPYLREHFDVTVFTAPGTEGEDFAGSTTRSTTELQPREFDRVLYQLGNEDKHAFMLPMIRAIGGTVMLHDWVLFDCAMGTYPGLGRGGLKGHALALREGGMEQARRYFRNWKDRRQEKVRPYRADANLSDLVGELLSGWHAPEPNGRWVADEAAFRLTGEGADSVEVELTSEPGRKVTLELADGSVLAEAVVAAGDTRLVLRGKLGGAVSPTLVLRTGGIRVSDEQRKYGDTRRLGSFIERVGYVAEGEKREIDLAGPVAHSMRPVSLDRDRFSLPFNRSVVRFADAFIVHSNYVKQLVLAERNAITPVGVLHHGAEDRWSDDDRKEARRELGLPASWVDGFLITSFGGVQPHKRVDKLLAAVALAREQRDDIHVYMAGRVQAEGFDPAATAAALGIADAVHFAGFVSEETGWKALHAGDIGVNLRGPTSGGTSGGIFQAFGLGRSVIASDAGEQHELPDSCVVKVPLGDGEVEALARELIDLRDHPERRDKLESAVREFVENECHWRVSAKLYADYLKGFPGHRATRRGLIALRLGQQK